MSLGKQRWDWITPARCDWIKLWRAKGAWRLMAATMHNSRKKLMTREAASVNFRFEFWNRLSHDNRKHASIINLFRKQGTYWWWETDSERMKFYSSCVWIFKVEHWRGYAVATYIFVNGIRKETRLANRQSQSRHLRKKDGQLPPPSIKQKRKITRPMVAWSTWKFTMQ